MHQLAWATAYAQVWGGKWETICRFVACSVCWKSLFKSVAATTMVPSYIAIVDIVAPEPRSQGVKGSSHSPGIQAARQEPGRSQGVEASKPPAIAQA